MTRVTPWMMHAAGKINTKKIRDQVRLETSSDWLKDVPVPFMLKIIQNFTCKFILLIERQS